MVINRFWVTGALAVCLVGVASAQFALPRRGSNLLPGNGQRQPVAGVDYVNGELMVKFRAGTGNAAALAHAAINAKVVNPDVAGGQKVRLPSGMSVDAAMRYYRRLPAVEIAEPNLIIRPVGMPNDPRAKDQWSLNMVKAPQAWDIDLGQPSIRIAIVDTGVDYNHEDLKGKVILGRDWMNNDDDPMDDGGHGTHCAGIAAAQTNNGVGVAGLGYNCSIIAVKSLQETGTLEAILKGCEEAAQKGAHVISMSYGSGFPSDLQRNQMRDLSNQGISMIAAAGNNNSPSQFYPAAYPEVIAVGSTNPQDTKSDFSNYGRDWVDVAAPGSGILSTIPKNGYAEFSGTSMACPLVSGLVGLMRSYATPDTTNNDLRKILEETCDDVGNWVDKGRVNAFAAMSNVIKPIPGTMDPKSASVFVSSGVAQGSNSTGVAGDLRVVDGSLFSIDSVYVNGTGSVAAPLASFNFSGDPAKFRSGRASITSSSHALATLILFMWNYDQERWVVIGNLKGSASTTESTLPLPANMRPYVRNGEVNAVLRASIPSRFRATASSFRLNIDRMAFDILMNP